MGVVNKQRISKKKSTLHTRISQHSLLWWNVFVTCSRYLSVPGSYVLQVYDKLPWRFTPTKTLHTTAKIYMQYNRIIVTHRHILTRTRTHCSQHNIFCAKSLAQIIHDKEHRNHRRKYKTRRPHNLAARSINARWCVINAVQTHTILQTFATFIFRVAKEKCVPEFCVQERLRYH